MPRVLRQTQGRRVPVAGTIVFLLPILRELTKQEDIQEGVQKEQGESLQS